MTSWHCYKGVVGSTLEELSSVFHWNEKIFERKLLSSTLVDPVVKMRKNVKFCGTLLMYSYNIKVLLTKTLPQRLPNHNVSYIEIACIATVEHRTIIKVVKCWSSGTVEASTANSVWMQNSALQVARGLVIIFEYLQKWVVWFRSTWIKKAILFDTAWVKPWSFDAKHHGEP